MIGESFLKVLKVIFGSSIAWKERMIGDVVGSSWINRGAIEHGIKRVGNLDQTRLSFVHLKSG